MNRNTGYGYSGLVGYAFDIIPIGIADRLRYAHFLTGVDPIYVGLFNYEDTGDGRSYRNTACVAYPYHQRLSKGLRHTTVVLPVMDTLTVVVHELGHVLDEYLGFRHAAKPVTKHALTNREEAFAEAFTSWLFYNYGEKIDDATKDLFESLVLGVLV